MFNVCKFSDMARNTLCKLGTFLFTVLLVSKDLWPHTFTALAFTSPKTITTAYSTYSLYDATVDKATADSLCTLTGYSVATFSSNVEFQAFLAALDADPEVFAEQFWIDVNMVGITPYFGSDPVTGASWFNGEPDGTCFGPCCYRTKPRTIFDSNGLADIGCTFSFNYACGGASTATTTTSPTTTTAETTTTTTPTTTVSETTTTTTPTTTTTDTTTTAPTTAVAVQTAALLMGDASSEGGKSVRLTRGEQMAILYLGIVLGGALALSCVCTGFWVGVNRKRGLVREYPDPQDSDDSYFSSSDEEDEEEAKEKDGEKDETNDNVGDEGYHDDDVDDESGGDNDVVDGVVYSIGGNLEQPQADQGIAGTDLSSAANFESYPNRKWLR